MELEISNRIYAQHPPPHPFLPPHRSAGRLHLLQQRKVEDDRFVHNQKLFEQFKGTAELKTKFEASQNKFKSNLDSIATLIQGGRTELTPIYQQRAEEFSMQQQQLTEKYTADIWKNINAEILNYGKDKGYDFILGASGNGSLMYANEAKDITEDVATYINARYDGKAR